MAFVPQGAQADYSARPSDQLIRDLYRIGEALLVRSAQRELQPLRLRYVASRLRRIPQTYAQFATAPHARDRDERCELPPILQVANLLRPYVTADADGSAANGAASAHAHSSPPDYALTFLCVCAFEGLLDDRLMIDDPDMALSLAQYLATGISLTELSQQARLSTGKLSSELSAIVGDLWNALPAVPSDDFPFDRALDFPLWELRRFRLLKRGV